MKVLVDTSVWIDFLNGRDTHAVKTLVKLIEAREDLCVCGFIYTEVLQGIRVEKHYTETKRLLLQLIYLPTEPSTFDLAATIFRRLRQQGITVRNSMDCLIAATVVQNQVRLLDADRDFEAIATHYPLGRLLE